jgi:hypothetical protein
MIGLAHGLAGLGIVLVAVTYPHPQPGDHWWDVINTNGRVIWLDLDRRWQEGNRVFAVHRLAPVINGHSDFEGQPDLILATDCRTGLKSFGVDEDWENGPLQPAFGLGLAMMRAVCQGR